MDRYPSLGVGVIRSTLVWRTELNPLLIDSNTFIFRNNAREHYIW